MEGYSVTEAASVLGVPTERVWELLARGVLAGTPEGETGMRVFLQPRPAPMAAEPRPPNGVAREPERELSPFRELLTEFRNLTERYGQALLALGEARGEVAALRSRVDLLEARMELRLPLASTPAAWPAPPAEMPVERHVVPPSPPAGAEAPAEHPTDATPGRGVGDAAPDIGEELHPDEEHRVRPRGPRRATERFAAALARAEDPSLPDLPPGFDAADGGPDEADAVEARLPREVPAAEPVLVADEADAGAASIAIEPGRVFTYGVRREGASRRLRVDFDLAKPVPAPPAPW